MIKNKNTGQIIVISAPSGAGKGTIIKKLLENNSKQRWLSISATSRDKREGEIEEQPNFNTNDNANDTKDNKVKLENNNINEQKTKKKRRCC